MFSFLLQPFIIHAVLAGTMIAFCSAIVGYLVIIRAQAFAAHTLSHVGFAGATGAALLGISSLMGMLFFTLLAALGIGSLEKRLLGRDVEIGMVLSLFLGLGVLFLHVYTTSASETVGVLFGSILSVTTQDLVITLITSFFTLLVLTFFFRPFLFMSIDPEIAQARGMNVRFLSMIFMVLLGITVAQAVQVVGILLVFALLIIPSAIAQHLSLRISKGIFIAVIVSVSMTWLGLLLAFLTPYPVSFYIATLSGIAYFVIVSMRHKIAPHQLSLGKHHSREVHWK